MSTETVSTSSAAISSVQDLEESGVTTYTWQIRVEHHSSSSFQKTIKTTPETKSDAACRLWEATKRSLGRKKKALVALGLLGVQVTVIPISGARSPTSYTADSAAMIDLSPKLLNDFDLSTFTEFFGQLNDRNYVVLLEFFNKRPILSKFRHVAVLLLALGVQIALAAIPL